MTYTSIPDMFFSQAQKLGNKKAQKVKRGGKWIDITWTEMGNTVQEVACGLLSLGLGRGDAVSLLSASRAEWVQCDLGIQSVGGITIPIYPSNTAEQAEYIVNNSESKFLIVENKAQLDKMLSVRKDMPNIKTIIVIDGTADSKEGILTLEDLKRQGREHAGKYKKVLDESLMNLKTDSVATIVYTSGTTGPPKGVILTNGFFLAMVDSFSQVIDYRPDEICLLFLPLAHLYARGVVYLCIYSGLIVVYAESIERVVDNMGEIRPHYVPSVPRVFEKAYATILANVQAGSPLKKKIFNWSIETGRQVSRFLQAKKPIPLTLRFRQALAHRLVFSKVQQVFGGRIRCCVSGGAPISKEILEFFHAAGIFILEFYSLSEALSHSNRSDHYKFGTVGFPLPGVEMKLALDGEILVKGPGICKGYFKRPEETKELFTEDGWLRTGDIGEVDSEGFLKITDRKKDLIKTAGGKYVAPQNIENLLKADPFISQAVVIGDRRPYCVALISITQADAERYAREKGIPFTSYEDLARMPQVYERVKKAVDSANARLASFETVKRFALVPRDFTQENDELTPTLKVKRKVVIERYKNIIDKLYTSS